LIGAFISLVQLLAWVAASLLRLGRIPGTDRFSESERNPDNVLIPGILIFGVEAGLVSTLIMFVTRC
jgi:hypothetical protein